MKEIIFLSLWMAISVPLAVAYIPVVEYAQNTWLFGLVIIFACLLSLIGAFFTRLIVYKAFGANNGNNSINM